MDKTAGLNEYLIGEAGNNIVLENGLSFFVDWEKGQKTGFFLDQRDARSMLKKYSVRTKSFEYI
jgi:23S rRNA (cytosine1962-C5)-methyltransferase